MSEYGVSITFKNGITRVFKESADWRWILSGSVGIRKPRVEGKINDECFVSFTADEVSSVKEIKL